ncbi:hypothetical protein AB1N83_011749 [Pleurotus pulmonarius]
MCWKRLGALVFILGKLWSPPTGRALRRTELSACLCSHVWHGTSGQNHSEPHLERHRARICSFDALMNAACTCCSQNGFNIQVFRKFRHMQHVQSCRQFVPVPFPFLEFPRNFFRFIAHQRSGSGSDSRTLDKASGLSIVSMTLP